MKPSLPGKQPGEILLVVRHRLPSLNRLFAMNPWQRLAEKRKTQVAFHAALCESQAIESDYSTLITLREARSIFWIAVNMLNSSGTTGHRTSRSKSGRKRSATRRTRGRK